MRTAYCPKSHRQLAFVTVGEPYGHVPGHKYHDVDVVISTRDDKFRCHIVESWGSAQGYDEEHGRHEAIGRGDSVVEAAFSAKQIATEAGITEYLAEAVSKAADEAIEALELPGPSDVLAEIHDADFSDCVNRGYAWTLYGDGHVVAVYRSRWQGSYDGARYVTKPDFVDVSEIGNGTDDDAEAVLTAAVSDIDPRDNPQFRQTRRGWKVR